MFKEKLYVILKFVLVIILFHFAGYIGSLLIYNNPNILENLISFDVSYYIRIAEIGYVPTESPLFIPETYAFFPSASILFRVLSLPFLGNIDYSIILYSIIMPAILSILTYKYILKSNLKQINIKSFVASFYYLIIPFGFFFTVPYSEIIFALSFVTLFISLKSSKKHYLPIGISSIFLSLSRPNSVAVIPASIILILFLLYKKRHFDLIKKFVISAFFQVLSIFLLFSYHFLVVGDFWAARNAQSLWGRSAKTTFNGFNLFERTVNNVSLATAHCTPYDVICYGKANFAVYGFFLWIFSSIIVFFKVKKTVLNLFLQLVNLFLFILPISSGSIGSFNRYMLLSPIVLIFFPQFLHSSFEKYKWVMPFFVILNIIFLTLFYNSFWLG